MNSIDATSISLNDLFTKDGDISFFKKYVVTRAEIPSFQRNYAWDIKHVKELLDSVSEYPKGYYLGNILIQKSKGSSSGDLIIDGQQRLTTIFLILFSLRRSGLSKQNKIKLEEIIFQNTKKQIPRILFTRENLNNSFCYLAEEQIEDEYFSDQNSRRFLKNFLFIKKYIEQNILDKNVFFEKIINLVFVEISFEQGFDINQLFEGLNSKGKKLSPVQLTKNALIGNIKYDSDLEIIDIWEDIEKSYEKEDRVIWFEKFLRHYGFLKYSYVSSSQLFVKIKNSLKKEDDILGFSKKFKEYSDLYLKIRNAQLVKKDISLNFSEAHWNIINQLLKHLAISDIDQVYAVVFGLFIKSKKDDSYRKNYFLPDFKKIWSFAILAKFLDLRPSIFERTFADFAFHLEQDDKKTFGENREKFFSKIMDIAYNSSSEVFKRNLNKRIKYTGDFTKKVHSYINSNFISLLLLCFLKEGSVFTIEGFTIEHIIPKGKKNGLSKWDNIDKKYLKDIKDTKIYQIGNLTLLSKDRLENESFDEKLKIYSKDTFFTKNKNLKKYQKLFNSSNPGSAVDKRGEEISNFLYQFLLKNLNYRD